MRVTHLTRILFTSLILSTALSACGGSKNEREMKALEAERPADELYNRAQAAMKADEYLTARKLFDEVERQHPYSKYAIDAQLQSAVASYRMLDYDAAVIALDRFVELHPGHESVPYAIYLKGLCYYEQISDVKRDQQMTQQALDVFDTLVRRFPDSDWSREAIYKRDLTLDHLAGKEMEVGRYYLTRGYTQAAINRFQYVVKNYDTTTHTPEALHRLVEAYLELGLEAQAVQVASVLGHNYPGSKWYERTYELLNPQLREKLKADRSWTDKTADWLLGSD
ncbi:MAG: outer membrane protein assembly factor BamD [Pseudobdellovibrionaceae bacterium]